MSFTTIKIGGQDVGIRFAYPCIRWFTEASQDNPDYFDKGESLTDIGVAKLLQFAYKNECVYREVKPVLQFSSFYDWVEKRVSITGETNEELAEVIKVFLESQPVQEQKEVVEKKNQEIVEDLKSEQTGMELKELSTERSESGPGNSE